MGADGLGLAFGAGLVAALNPCGFAMLPAYLTLVVRGGGAGAMPALVRALAATAAMAVGFITVFGAFGLLAVSAANVVLAVPAVWLMRWALHVPQPDAPLSVRDDVT